MYDTGPYQPDTGLANYNPGDTTLVQAELSAITASNWTGAVLNVDTVPATALYYDTVTGVWTAIWTNIVADQDTDGTTLGSLHNDTSAGFTGHLYVTVNVVDNLGNSGPSPYDDGVDGICRIDFIPPAPDACTSDTPVCLSWIVPDTDQLISVTITDNVLMGLSPNDTPPIESGDTIILHYQVGPSGTWQQTALNNNTISQTAICTATINDMAAAGDSPTQTVSYWIEAYDRSGNLRNYGSEDVPFCQYNVDNTGPYLFSFDFNDSCPQTYPFTDVLTIVISDTGVGLNCGDTSLQVVITYPDTTKDTIAWDTNTDTYTTTGAGDAVIVTCPGDNYCTVTYTWAPYTLRFGDHGVAATWSDTLGNTSTHTDTFTITTDPVVFSDSTPVGDTVCVLRPPIGVDYWDTCTINADSTTLVMTVDFPVHPLLNTYVPASEAIDTISARADTDELNITVTFANTNVETYTTGFNSTDTYGTWAVTDNACAFTPGLVGYFEYQGLWSGTYNVEIGIDDLRSNRDTTTWTFGIEDTTPFFITSSIAPDTDANPESCNLRDTIGITLGDTCTTTVNILACTITRTPASCPGEPFETTLIWPDDGGIGSWDVTDSNAAVTGLVFTPSADFAYGTYNVWLAWRDRHHNLNVTTWSFAIEDTNPEWVSTTLQGQGGDSVTFPVSNTLSAAAAAGATMISVTDADGFKVGDNVNINADTGNPFTITVINGNDLYLNKVLAGSYAAATSVTNADTTGYIREEVTQMTITLSDVCSEVDEDATLAGAPQWSACTGCNTEPVVKLIDVPSTTTTTFEDVVVTGTWTTGTDQIVFTPTGLLDAAGQPDAISSLPAGTYEVTFCAIDNAGNSEPIVFNFVVDTNEPTLTHFTGLWVCSDNLIDDTESSTVGTYRVGGEIDLTVEAPSDPDLDYVVLEYAVGLGADSSNVEIDNATWNPLDWDATVNTEHILTSGPPYMASGVDIPDLIANNGDINDGNLIYVRARAVDNAGGNLGDNSVPIRLYVDGTPPDVTLTLVGSSYADPSSPPTNTTLTAAASGNSITVDDTSGFTVNGLAVINDGTRVEAHIITAINGNVLALANSLSKSYDTGSFVDSDEVSVDDDKAYTLEAVSDDPTLTQVTFYASYNAFTTGMTHTDTQYPFQVDVTIPAVNNYSPINTTPYAFYVRGEDDVCNGEDPTDTNTVNVRAEDKTPPEATITQVSNTNVVSMPQAHIPAVDGVLVYVRTDDDDGLNTTTDVLKVSLEFMATNSDSGSATTTPDTWTTIATFADTEDFTDPMIFAWDTHHLNSDLYNTHYLLRAKITDWEGNYSYSGKITIKVEGTCLTMPWIMIPEDNSETKGMVTISADIYETGAHKVKFEWMDASDTSDTWHLIAEIVGSSSGEPAHPAHDWTTLWDTTGLGDGDYLIRATSTDIYINDCVGDTITVTIDNTINCAGASISAPAQIGGDNYIPGPDERVVTLTLTLADTHDIASVSFDYEIIEGYLKGDTTAGFDTTAATPSADSTTWTVTFRGTFDSRPIDYNANIVFRAILSDNVGNTCTVTTESLLIENYDPTSCIVWAKDQNGNEDIPLGGNFVDTDAADRFTGSGLDFLFTASDNKNVDCVSLAYFELDPRLYLTEAVTGGNTITVSDTSLVDTDNMICVYDSGRGDTVQTVKVTAINGSVLTVRPALSNAYAVNAGVAVWVIDGQDCEYPFQMSLDVSGLNGLYVFSTMAKDIASGSNVEYPEWDDCSLALGIDHQCPITLIEYPYENALISGDTVAVQTAITSHQGDLYMLTLQYMAEDTTEWTSPSAVQPIFDGLVADGPVSATTYMYFDRDGDGRFTVPEPFILDSNINATFDEGTDGIFSGDTTGLTDGTALNSFPDSAVENFTGFPGWWVIWVDANGDNTYNGVDVDDDLDIDWGEDIVWAGWTVELDLRTLPPTNGTDYALRVNSSDWDDAYANAANACNGDTRNITIRNLVLDTPTAFTIEPCTAGETAIAVGSDTMTAPRITADMVRIKSRVSRPNDPAGTIITLYSYPVSDTTNVTTNGSDTVAAGSDTVSLEVDVSAWASDVYFFWTSADGPAPSDNTNPATSPVITLAIDNTPPEIVDGPEIQNIDICEPTINGSGDGQGTFDIGSTLFVGANDTYTISVTVTDTTIPNSDFEDTFARVKEVTIQYSEGSGPTFTDITDDSTTQVDGIYTADWNSANRTSTLSNNQLVTLQVTMTDVEDDYTTACSNTRVDTFTFYADNVAPEARIDSVDSTTVNATDTSPATVHVWGEEVLIYGLVDFNPYDTGSWQANDITDTDANGAVHDVCRVNFYRVNTATWSDTTLIGSGDSTDTDGDGVDDAYSVRWQSPTPGIYSVFAIATDIHGNQEIMANEMVTVVVHGLFGPQITLGGASLPEAPNSICDDNDTPIAADNFGNPVFESGVIEFDPTGCRKTKISGDDLDLYVIEQSVNIDTTSVEVELDGETYPMTLIEDTGDSIFDYTFKLYESDFPYYSYSAEHKAKFEDVQVVVGNGNETSTTHMIHGTNNRDDHVWEAEVSLQARDTYSYSFLVDAVGNDFSTDDPRNTNNIVVPPEFYYTNIDISGLGDAEYTIIARVNDTRGEAWETEVSKLIIIDRTPPEQDNITLEIADVIDDCVEGKHIRVEGRVRAGNECTLVAFVADPDDPINKLEVAGVLFQYSKEGNDTTGKSTWVDIGTDVDADTGWQVPWTPPATDQNLPYWIRAVAFDDGHNYQTMIDGIEITIDGTQAKVQIDQITLSGDTASAEIIEKGDVLELRAALVLNEDDYEIYGVTFEYSIDEVDQNSDEVWYTIPANGAIPSDTCLNTTVFADEDGYFHLTWYTAESHLPDSADAYIQLRAVAEDQVGNEDDNPRISLVVLDDTTAPNAYILWIKNCVNRNILDPYLAVTDRVSVYGLADTDTAKVRVHYMSATGETPDTWTRINTTHRDDGLDTGNFVVEWDTLNIAAGRYLLVAEPLDADGNGLDADLDELNTVEVLVDHIPPDVVNFNATAVINVNDTILFEVDADATSPVGKYGAVQAEKVTLQIFNESTGEWLGLGSNFDLTFTNLAINGDTMDKGIWRSEVTLTGNDLINAIPQSVNIECTAYIRALVQDYACNTNKFADQLDPDSLPVAIKAIQIDGDDPEVLAVYAGNYSYEGGEDPVIIACGGDTVDLYVKIIEDCSGLDTTLSRFQYLPVDYAGSTGLNTPDTWKTIDEVPGWVVTNGREELYNISWTTPLNQLDSNAIYQIRFLAADIAGNTTTAIAAGGDVARVKVQKDCTAPDGDVSLTVTDSDLSHICDDSSIDGIVTLRATATMNSAVGDYYDSSPDITGDALPGYDISLTNRSDTAEFYYSIKGTNDWKFIGSVSVKYDTTTSTYVWPPVTWDSAQVSDEDVLFEVRTTITDWAGNESDILTDDIEKTINNPRADVRVTTGREAERTEEFLIEAEPDDENDVAAVAFWFTLDDPNSDTATWKMMTAVTTSANTDTNMTEGNYGFRWDVSKDILVADFMDDECNCYADSLPVTVVGIAWDDDCGRAGDTWPYGLTDSDTFPGVIDIGWYITVYVKDTIAPKITLTQISYQNDCMSDSKTLILPQEEEDMIISGLVDIWATSEGAADDLNTGSAHVTFIYRLYGNDTWDTIDMDPIHTYGDDTDTTTWVLRNWDTKAPKLDNVYEVGIRATDVFGNTTEEVYPFKVRIDNTHPTDAELTIKGPATDSEREDNILERGEVVLLSATVTGAELNDVTQAEFFYKVSSDIDGAWTQITLDPNTANTIDYNFPYSANWRVSKDLMVGTDYDIKVVVSDRVGCSAEGILTMRLEDNVAGALITRIETDCNIYGNTYSDTMVGTCEDVNGARISGVVTLYAAVDDEVKRVIFKYRQVGGDWITAADEGRTSEDTTTWFILANWDTTGLAEGAYELAAIGTDDLGHTDTNPQVITVIIDRSADFEITSTNLSDNDVVGFADNTVNGEEDGNATIDLMAVLEVTDNDLQKDTTGRYTNVQFGFKLCADIDTGVDSWNWIGTTPTYDSLTGNLSLGMAQKMFTDAGGQLNNCCYDFAVKIKDKAYNVDYRVLAESVSVDNLDPLACITSIGGDMTLDQPVDVSDSDAVKIRVTATDLCTNIENLQFQLATRLEAAPVDIVWIIDSSGSMSPYQTAIANNADTFVGILDANNVDYRLGVVDFSLTSFPKNTDGTNGAPGAGTGQWTTDTATFALMVTSVGDQGSGTENGLTALNATLNHYAFRQGATKVFILVTDEDSDDHGNTPALEQTTITVMQNNKAVVYGILDPGDDDPYPNVITQTGGLTGNISTPDWSGTLGQMAQGITQLVLEFDPDWQDIDVEISTDTEPASYTITWNTTGLPAGSYFLRVIATDSVGNINSGNGCIREVVIKDTLPPIAAICGYDDFQLDNVNETIANRYVDAIYAVAYCPDVAEVQFQYSQDTGATWINIGRATNPIAVGGVNVPGRDAYSLWKATWTSNSKPAAGTYQLRALAKDNAGNRDVSLAPITRITVDAEGNVTVADVPGVILGEISLSANLIDYDDIQITAQIYGDDAPLRTVLVVVEDAANNVTEEIIQLYPKTGDPYQDTYVGVTTINLSTITFGGQITIFTCGTDNFGNAGATSEHKYKKLIVYPVTLVLGTNGTVGSGDGIDNDGDGYIDEPTEANNIEVTIPGNSVTNDGGLLMLPTITPITDADQLRYIKPLAQAYDLQLLNATGFNRGYEPEVKITYDLTALETKLGRSIDTRTELSVRYWNTGTNKWTDVGLFNINIGETTITFNVTNNGVFNNIYTIVWKRASIIHGVVFGQYDGGNNLRITEKTYKNDPEKVHYVTTAKATCGDMDNDFDAIAVLLAESNDVDPISIELTIDGVPVANNTIGNVDLQKGILNNYTHSILASDLHNDAWWRSDVDELSEGQHTLGVYVRDEFGKEYTESYTFEIDNTPPMMEIIGGALASNITYFDPQTSTLDVVFVDRFSDQGVGIDLDTLFAAQEDGALWMDIFKIIQPGADDQGNVVNHQRKTLMVTTSVDGMTRQYSDNYSNDGDHSNDIWQNAYPQSGLTTHQAYRLSYKFNEGTMKDGDTFQVVLYGNKNPAQVIDNFNEWHLDQLTYLFENPEEGLTYLIDCSGSACVVVVANTEQYDLLANHYPDSTTWTPNDPFWGYYMGFNLPDALENCRFVNYAVRNFVIDKTAPAITSNLASLADVIYTNGESINIIATASDQGAGLKSLVIEAVGAKNTLSSTNGVLIIEQPLGRYVVTITATDRVGRITIERKVLLAVPEMASSVSDGGTVLNGQTITICFEVDIEDTGRITLKLDGKPVAASQYRIEGRCIVYTPTDLSVGEHTLIVLVDGQEVYDLNFITEAATLSFGDAHNYPNPFDGSTIITYQMTKTARVTIKIYDLAGDLIKTLCENETHAPGGDGYDRVTWYGDDDGGSDAANGVYLCYIKVADGSKTFTKVIKIAVLR